MSTEGELHCDCFEKGMLEVHRKESFDANANMCIEKIVELSRACTKTKLGEGILTSQNSVCLVSCSSGVRTCVCMTDSYSAGFKVRVLDWHHASGSVTKRTSKCCGVSVSTIQSWVWQVRKVC